MNNKELNPAVNVLQTQIDKGNDSGIHYATWKIQSQSIIEKYFSKDSKEYSWFDRRIFSDAHYGINVDEHYRQETIKAIKDTQAHLKAAIDTLKIKGIYKPPKPNFLYRLSDTWLTFIIGIMLSAYVGVFYIGKWASETERKSNTTSIPVTSPVTENPTSEQTKSTNDTSKHENK
jgi:hypothetical protein